MIMSKFLERIKGKGRGAIFAPTDLLDLGSRASVDQALSRLTGQGVIRRLARGLYYYPKLSVRFGMVYPSVDDVARAIARKDHHVLQISPATAANQLGLSTQVPSKTIYMTDGPTRTKTVGRQVIHFRNASRKTLVGAGQMSGAVFQALRYVGKDGVTDLVISTLARALNNNDRGQLQEQVRQVPVWMFPVVQRIIHASCEIPLRSCP